MMHDEMDEEKKKMIMEELEKIGIAKDKIDDHMVWGVKKMSYGMMKIMWSLKESGMKEDEAKKMVSKMTEKMMEMDMSKEMEKWEHNKEHCSDHCQHHC